jgi:hypothetical protein
MRKMERKREKRTEIQRETESSIPKTGQSKKEH